MLFLELAQTFEKMEKTRSRLELTSHLVELLDKTPSEVIDKVVYLIQGKLGPDYESNELGVAEKIVIKSLALATGKPIKNIISNYNSEGDLGEVAFKISTKEIQTTLMEEPMTIQKVFGTLVKISSTSGSGSLDVKIKYVQGLLNNASRIESKYLVKLILGNLRLGIANFTLIDALALVFTNDKKNRTVLERAFNVSSDLGRIAMTLANYSLSEVQSISVTLFIPVRPMLAERASNSAEALKKLNGNGLAEFKIDGERIQIHKENDKVELYTRSLENVTSNFPDIVTMISTLAARDLIVEGEIVAINPKNLKYLPFQNLMHRRRKYKIQETMIAYPIMLNLFDVLYFEGVDKTDTPLHKRRQLLEHILNGNNNDRLKLIEQIDISKVEDIERFLVKSLESGCEGLMLKNPNSDYRAGARGWAWIKLKKEYSTAVIDSLDLVILGALYGKGRRVGRFGALLLGSYSQENDTFFTICKVGTGFTDDVLSSLSDKLGKIVSKEKSPRIDNGSLSMDVWFEPKVVLEIISPEITLSPVYTTARNLINPGYGLALRFPKFSGKVREDKSAEDSTTIAEVVQLYQNQLKQKGSPEKL